MGLRRLSLAAAAAVLGLAAVRSDAIITDDTSWYCAYDETIKVTGFPKQVDSDEGITLAFDESANLELYLPTTEEFYFGTVEAKGTKGFVVTPDANAVLDLRAYVEEQVLFITGADDVDIATFTVTIKGKVVDDVLKGVLKAKGKGSVSLGGRTRKGSGKLTEKFVSLPPG